MMATLPETNSLLPKNGGFQQESPNFQGAHFQGRADLSPETSPLHELIMQKRPRFLSRMFDLALRSESGRMISLLARNLNFLTNFFQMCWLDGVRRAKHIPQGPKVLFYGDLACLD